MIVEIGHFALVLAFALSLVQFAAPLLGTRLGDERLMAVGGPAALAGLLLVLISFAALTVAYVTSDFSVLNVYENSHSQKPMLYKITGVWGNHEGSLLLWVLILSLFGALVVLFGRNLPSTLRANVISIQGLIGVAFLLFLLGSSNPFTRLDPAPMEGNDLNPLLQDIGLAVHPPLLYLGYVGFSICFSFAVAALIEGRLDAAWARWVRPWTLAAWVFLTGGIAMGSYWAYYELGWGGFWFWDPVENASFLPWLCGTAMLHSAIVMEKRSALKIWTVLLAILTFSLSLLGTFLVRSGVLTSVHAFATDPTRGVYILAILIFFIGGSLALFAIRASSLSTGGLFQPISREGALVLNNLFLTTATATVLIGTLYPLLVEAVTGEKISVGAPFFNLTFGPLIIPLLLAVPFGPLLAWKRGDLGAVMQRLSAAAIASLLSVGFVYFFIDGASVLAAFGVGLAAWLILGPLVDLWQKSGAGKVGIGVAWNRFVGLPRSVFGTALAHMGLGLSTLGVVSVTTLEIEQIAIVRPGDIVEVGHYRLRFEGLETVQGPNYIDDEGRFTISRDDGRELGSIVSSKRMYTARQMPTTEAGLVTRGLSQLYVALGEPAANDGIVVRAWWKPLVLLIWIGSLFMMLGGTLSLLDRRLRIGAPARKEKPVSAAVPAE